jgi:hypothetical protein
MGHDRCHWHCHREGRTRKPSLFNAHSRNARTLRDGRVQRVFANSALCYSRPAVSRAREFEKGRDLTCVGWHTQSRAGASMLFPSSRADKNGHADEQEQKGKGERRGLLGQEPMASGRRGTRTAR